MSNCIYVHDDLRLMCKDFQTRKLWADCQHAESMSKDERHGTKFDTLWWYFTTALVIGEQNVSLVWQPQKGRSSHTTRSFSACMCTLGEYLTGDEHHVVDMPVEDLDNGGNDYDFKCHIASEEWYNGLTDDESKSVRYGFPLDHVWKPFVMPKKYTVVTIHGDGTRTEETYTHGDAVDETWRNMERYESDAADFDEIAFGL